MKPRNWMIPLLLLSTLAAGCASGPAYEEIAGQIPALKADQGRVFFYRSSSPFGCAVQPSVNLNGASVGQSKPGGFFFVDHECGPCTVSCCTEAENTLSFSLRPQETKYVRTYVTMGFFVGHVSPELVNPETGLDGVKSCCYTGKPLPPLHPSPEPDGAPENTAAPAEEKQPSVPSP
jgi:uncharacterized protein DUF2846